MKTPVFISLFLLACLCDIIRGYSESLIVPYFEQSGVSHQTTYYEVYAFLDSLTYFFYLLWGTYVCYSLCTKSLSHLLVYMFSGAWLTYAGMEVWQEYRGENTKYDAYEIPVFLLSIGITILVGIKKWNRGKT